MSRPSTTGKRLASDPPRAAHAAEILKALGHPLRLRIIATLCQGEKHVSRLAERLAAPQAIISQQLRILRMNGLVSATRSRGHAHYSISQPGLYKLVQCLDGCCQERLDDQGV